MYINSSNCQTVVIEYVIISDEQFHMQIENKDINILVHATKC